MQYPDKAVLATDLAEVVADQLVDAIEAQGKASLAVPGGATPAAFLRALSKQDIPWEKVSIMLTDERFVDEDSERSNTRLLKETLLQGKAAEATLVPMVAAGNAPEDVLDALIGGLKPALPLDVAVLGMGEDMHTASLFPAADKLAEALSDDAPTLLPMRAEGAGEPRITLTAPVLKGAGAVHLLITGPAKLAALQQALLEGPESQAPVRVVLSRDDAEIHYAE
jgi:6-phosphogluconolactonase